jgi:hypothetical protein
MQMTPIADGRIVLPITSIPWLRRDQIDAMSSRTHSLEENDIQRRKSIKDIYTCSSTSH